MGEREEINGGQRFELLEHTKHTIISMWPRVCSLVSQGIWVKP